VSEQGISRRDQILKKTEQQKQFINFLTAKMFNVSKACKAFGISRKTYYQWLDRDPEFAEMVWEAREAEKDIFEDNVKLLARGIPKVDKDGKLIGWVERPDTASAIFLNKTQNKDRGYIEGPEKADGTIEDDSLDFSRLTQDERTIFFNLLEKATIQKDSNIEDAEIIE